MIDGNEFYKYSKYSWQNKFFVNPIPTNKSGVYKIEKDLNGKKTIGVLEYHDKPKKGELSIWNKILEMYKEYYDKNEL